LLSRPKAEIAAEQERHDRAKARGLTAFFCALFVGGGLAAFIVLGPLFRDRQMLQDILVCLVFVVPLVVSFIVLVRVPPPPFEALSDAHRDIDRKQAEWRAILLMQVFTLGLVAAETIWWPAPPAHAPQWLAAALSLPVLLVILPVIAALYVRPGWLNPDLKLLMDDEVTRSFRARAQRLGYLLLLFLLLGFCVLARVDAKEAARYMPLGLVAGCVLPVLYFVFLDWQASRSG
jgi:hypothetical protein